MLDPKKGLWTLLMMKEGKKERESANKRLRIDPSKQLSVDSRWGNRKECSLNALGSSRWLGVLWNSRVRKEFEIRNVLKAEFCL